MKAFRDILVVLLHNTDLESEFYLGNQSFKSKALKMFRKHTPPPLELSPELLLPCNEEHTPFCFDLYILRGGVYKASQKQEFQKIDLSYHY